MAGDSAGFHGASLSIWLAVGVIIAGSILGGIALIEWVWPLFWVGVALIVGGALGGYFSGIMGAVSEFSVVHTTEIEGS